MVRVFSFGLFCALILSSLLFANAADDHFEGWTEANAVDSRWQSMDTGPFFSGSIRTANGIVRKGLAIKVGDQQQAAVLYDTESMQLKALWQGKFIQFDPARFGLISAPSIGSTNQHAAPAAFGISFQNDFAWNPKPSDELLLNLPRYRGLFLKGDRVVLKYSIGEVEVMESPWFEVVEGKPIFTRNFEVKNATSNTVYLALAPESVAQTVITESAAVEAVPGKPARAKIQAGAGIQNFVAAIAPAETRLPEGFLADHDAQKFFSITNNPPSLLWKEELVTSVLRGKSDDAYTIDTLAIPYENRWKALMFLSGLDFFSNGDAAVCTVHGDAWLVRGKDASFDKATQLKWKRFATGLYQPLGLKIVDDKIYVTGRDQITRLHDTNSDGEADFYENFNNQIWTSSDGHDYVACLETDSKGNFHIVSPRGVHRISADGKKFETIAEGFRNPNGLGVGPGDIVTVAPQEGNWTPASMICEIQPNGFYGYGGPRNTPTRKNGYDAPLCWIPRPLDNSSGGQVWTTGNKFGPLQNQMLHISFGRCAIMMVLRDSSTKPVNAAIVPLKGRFLSGVMRGRMHPADGQLYLVGENGWVTSALKDGCFQRVRYTGKSIQLPLKFKTIKKGLEIKFNEALDPASVQDIENFSANQWNYKYSADYGSQDWSVKNADKPGHDPVKIEKAELLADGKTVRLHIPELEPAMTLQVSYNLDTADGDVSSGNVYFTLHTVP